MTPTDPLQAVQELRAELVAVHPCLKNYPVNDTQSLVDLVVPFVIEKESAARRVGYAEHVEESKVEMELLRARLRTIGIAGEFGENTRIVRRIAELEYTEHQATQYIKHAQEREQEINKLRDAVKAGYAEGERAAYLRCAGRMDRCKEPWHSNVFTKWADEARALPVSGTWTCPNGDHACNLRGYCVNKQCDKFNCERPVSGDGGTE